MLLVAAAAVAPASPAVADPPATLYVNNERHCDDAGAGTEALPYCTIQAAEQVVVPGQTVAIGGATPFPYVGTLTITRSGSAGAPITFTSYGSVTPTLDALTLSGVHDVTVSGLRTFAQSGPAAIQVTGSSNVRLDRMGVERMDREPSSGADLAIDGDSSNVTLSLSHLSTGEGPAVRVAPGASHVVLTTNRLSLFASSDQDAVSISGAVAAVITSNDIDTACNDAIAIDGGSSAVVENNVISIDTSSSCPSAGLSIGADSTNGVHSDYNAYYVGAGAVEDVWAGTGYPTAAAFHSATGQGAHDLDLSTKPDLGSAPPERSPLIDSADANALGELSADLLGNPRVDDTLVADTGAGTPAPDRGVYERQDQLALTDVIDPAKGVGPLTTNVTVSSRATSVWSEPISYAVDFGDGDASVAVAPGATATHTYLTPGVYTETTTATDTGGSRQTVAHTVAVGTAAPPPVSLTVRPDFSTDDSGRPDIVAGVGRATATVGSDEWEVTNDQGQVDWGDGTSGYIGFGDVAALPYHYRTAGTYTVQLTTTDLIGRVSTATGSVTVGDGFLSASSDAVRVYDSRSGGIDKVPAGGVVKLALGQLNAYGDADAALVNVTVTNTKASGFIAVYPDGTPTPSTSNVDYAAGQTVANHALALAGSDGLVDFYNHSSGPVDVIIDSYGYQVRGEPADTYQPAGPVRVLDTRSGLGARVGAVAAKGTVTFQVAGTNGVPADAAAVVMNLTATDTKSAGYITAYPDGTTRPLISNADWAAGQTACSLVVVPLTDGKVTLYNSGPGTADFLADLVGYYHQYGTAAVFLPSQPTRLMDTRSGLGTSGHIAKLQPGQTITLPVAPHIDAPAAGVTSVEVNLTATNPSSTGYITAYPHGAARPTTSSVDFAGGQTAANMTITPVGTDGSIDLYNGGGSTVDLLVDLYGGYFQYPSN